MSRWNNTASKSRLETFALQSSKSMNWWRDLREFLSGEASLLFSLSRFVFEDSRNIKRCHKRHSVDDNRFSKELVYFTFITVIKSIRWLLIFDCISIVLSFWGAFSTEAFLWAFTFVLEAATWLLSCSIVERFRFPSSELAQACVKSKRFRSLLSSS